MVANNQFCDRAGSLTHPDSFPVSIERCRYRHVPCQKGEEELSAPRRSAVAFGNSPGFCRTTCLLGCPGEICVAYRGIRAMGHHGRHSVVSLDRTGSKIKAFPNRNLSLMSTTRLNKSV
ncbi:hypothetical protein DTO021D3_7838 [Paecilomyces variotii]|nr:hypothetical protein DTO032I3_8524 [Paecilomyces variotii]KAJ9261614.1 hypothetical protein DTO212C5_8257 [Paecilomyces variotii]KAJ9275300.1 hypothetical protein DTO021D3_7838 [Paecilomyces variotii]KAJ9339284.1 hypothetical protein DTO027B6_8167 [Paecilomyces variotii]KAJ9378440.1 hypothetical protein DTO032I4_7690 [Paecilomyces variotii]